MKDQTLFSGKNIMNLSSAESAQRVVKVKEQFECCMTESLKKK